jgi:hypothetical protein
MYPPLSKVRLGEKKVRSERWVYLRHGCALDKGGYQCPPRSLHPLGVENPPIFITLWEKWYKKSAIPLVGIYIGHPWGLGQGGGV